MLANNATMGFISRLLWIKVLHIKIAKISFCSSRKEKLVERLLNSGQIYDTYFLFTLAPTLYRMLYNNSTEDCSAFRANLIVLHSKIPNYLRN